jgi:hypothetical protein
MPFKKRWWRKALLKGVPLSSRYSHSRRSELLAGRPRSTERLKIVEVRGSRTLFIAFTRFRRSLGIGTPPPSPDGIDRTARGRGQRLVGERDAELGYETPSVRIFDKMQNTLEEVVLSLGPADVDNGGTFELLAEEPNHALMRIVLQCMEGFVDHDPTGLAQ